jgi:hypothetical protein
VDDLPGERLRQAIEDLYTVFAGYALPPHVEGCAHCVFEADHKLLYSADLRHLHPGDLEKYARKAMTTWGDPNDFRHFLPRIFELICLNTLWESLDLEIVFSKLDYGEWRSWPAEEQEAITSFLVALWTDVLDHYPHAFDMDTCLCCLGQAEDDLGPYLSMWRIAGSLPAALHFNDFIEHNTARFPTKRPQRWKLRDAFWEDRPKAAQQVSSWLLSPTRKEELETAFFKFSGDAENARILSEANQTLGYLHAMLA